MDKRQIIYIRGERLGMKKVFKITTITVLVTVLVFISIPIFIYGVADGTEYITYIFKVWSIPDPPKPKITYGEFPFTLVYEINGEEKVIEDILICEYDGIVVYGGIPNKMRSWKESLKSGNKRIILLKIDETNIVYYPIRNSAGYYMGDKTSGEIKYSQNAGIDDIEKNPNYVYDRYISAEELLNHYNIRITRWEIALPITNSFK